jgi:copper(I)-binding protein
MHRTSPARHFARFFPRFFPRFTSPHTLLAACAFGCAAFAHAATAPVTVEGAWARASVPGQSTSGAFMRLTAREAETLVGAETPAAGRAEVHEMKMDGNVMRMREVPALPLPAGRSVELKPGSYHLMLQELKAPLKPGTSIPLTLRFRDAKGAASSVQLSVPVLTRAPDEASAKKH